MRNIIFDWSGVVKDVLKGHLWIVNRIFKNFGVDEISLEEFKENWEQPYFFFYKKYLPNITIKEEQITYREALFHKDCPKSKDFPGITELIKKLKEKGYFLAIVSLDFPETVFSEIEEYGLKDIFNEIVTNVHDKLEGINNLIKNKNLELQNTFFIGDSNHEIEVSKTVGIKSIAVTWGFNNEQKLKSGNPDFLVHNVDELEKIIL